MPDPQPSPELPPLPEPPPQGAPAWPPHQRLLGVVIRGPLAFAGTLPLALYILAEEYHRFEWEWVWVNFAVLVCSLILFAWEKRGVPWWSTVLRLAGAGAACAVVAPLTVLWVSKLGDPTAGYQQVGRLLRPDRLGLLIGAAFGAAMFFPALGAWFYVRARTASLLPQAAAGVASFLPLVLLFFCSRDSEAVLVGVFVLLTCGLVPLGAWFGDRLASERDPLAPGPPEEAEVRPAMAASLLAAWAVHALLAVGVSSFQWGHPMVWDTVHAQRTLERMVHAQTTRLEDLGEAAGSLSELPPEAGPPSDALGLDRSMLPEVPADGLVGTYVLRMTRARTNPRRWSCAADPIAGRASKRARHLIVNQDGQVYSSDEGPIPLDPEACSISVYELRRE